MKKIHVILVLLSIVLTASANHTKGGWMYYRYEGTVGGNARYEITLKIYTECILNNNQWCDNINFTIFHASNGSFIENVNVPFNDSLNIQNCATVLCHPCINPVPNICYKIATYRFTKDFPLTIDGYVISYQRCCRIANIINMAPGSSGVGDTWTVTIPGTGGADPLAYKNSSALFAQNDTAIICRNNPFIFDFSAFDPDNDSLTYVFSDAYTGQTGSSCGTSTAYPPPYISIVYAAGFSGSQPMGPTVNIDPFTGMVSGIAPSTPGTYVLTCTVSEYKRGTFIKKSEVRKSLHIRVEDCSLTQAVLQPEYVSCDGYTVQFSNLSNSPNIQTYFWDFGVVSLNNDTSNLPDPIYTYPDTGLFLLKLVVNRNLPCSDSTTSIVKVFPGFHPGFTVAGQCKNTPIQFTDTSTADFGSVNFWRWDFGELLLSNDTSRLQNPTHVYPLSGTYNVSFVVASNKGCRDTILKPVFITDKPALTVTHDTLICSIDTLQLHAIGMGTFAWSPNYMINDIAIPDPLVSPDISTRYTVVLTDPYGCVGRDSVYISVKDFVTMHIGNDTTICRGDAMQISLQSDALHHVWTPVTGLNDPFIRSPVAKPVITTTYHVTGNIGKCTAEDSIHIRTVDYPDANAGPDTAICTGTNGQLHASGGTTYSWRPSAFLSAANIPDPMVVNPPSSVRYIVTVKDTLGCPKTRSDTMILKVVHIKADAGPHDTTVVLGQPLLLTASGGTIYQWSPSIWLSNSGSAVTVSLPLDNIDYIIKVSDPAGCFAFDTIRIKLFKTNPGLFVPTAFTPNGDGLNDLFRPIPLGLKSLDKFEVFNRWGQLLYSGTDEGSGWDGKYGGREQAAATYVWYAEGTDYKNQKIFRKGYVVLIR